MINKDIVELREVVRELTQLVYELNKLPSGHYFPDLTRRIEALRDHCNLWPKWTMTKKEREPIPPWNSLP